MAVSQHTFQAPKGTRDFYPADMAVRRYIEGVWRSASVNHGFDEIEGPTFEHLDLYTHKSGPGIVSELFSFTRTGGETTYALRPEFTPTLARMVAARAAQLPKPIKWFTIPSHYRAERPQRGRLREFVQWNVDFIGGEDDPAKADAEVIACAVAAMERFGLTPADVQVRLSQRDVVARLLHEAGVIDDEQPHAFALLDKRGKLPQEELVTQAEAIGLDLNIFDQAIQRMTALASGNGNGESEVATSAEFDEFRNAFECLHELGISEWCRPDLSIVRGLAYYTGTVFEVIAEGERAVAGGGRYDKLVESFGGPSMPACGFGMGDVVLGLLLKEKGLLEVEAAQPSRPDAFVIAANDDAAAGMLSIVAQLRKHGLHIRHSYRSTRNVGKLLGDAGKQRARHAIILGEELAESHVALKNLDSGEQSEVELSTNMSELIAALQE